MIETVDPATQSLLLRTYLAGSRRPPEPTTPYAVAPSVGAPADPGGLPPASTTEAVRFIHAHAREPIGLTEIAAAAGLSPRALQAAFRRHLGITPLAYLRRERLAQAHAALASARAEDGVTVSSIASACGFDQLSRFARDYKGRYGVSPRETLHRSEP